MLARYEFQQLEHPQALLRADWWCGLQRVQHVQPGSASGTQAQKSWHRHKLKKYTGLHTLLATFSTNLASFSSSRVQNLHVRGTPFSDIPQQPFPDRVLLYDSEMLIQQGRSSAHQFYRTRMMFGQMKAAPLFWQRSSPWQPCMYVYM